MQNVSSRPPVAVYGRTPFPFGGKALFLLTLCLFLSAGAAAQRRAARIKADSIAATYAGRVQGGAHLHFYETTHDFGDIPRKGGNLVRAFEFVNDRKCPARGRPGRTVVYLHESLLLETARSTGRARRRQGDLRAAQEGARGFQQGDSNLFHLDRGAQCPYGAGKFDRRKEIMTLFFRNCKVLPMTAAAGEPNCFDGYVGVEGRRIALVTADAAAAEAWRAAHAGAREIDGRGGILMPGLVNTHCHMAMTLQRSYADDMALMEWLNDHIWPFEARQTDDDIRVGALLGAAEMLLGGVTSVVDMYWSEAAVFDAVDRAGMRALLCASYLDTRLEAFESDLPALVEKCEGSSRIRAGLAPHAAYTCSAENLRRGMEACRRYGIPMTTHIAETLDEVRMIRERYGATPVEYLDSLGVLDGGLIAAHCVHLTDGDRRILRERGVHVAHCPTSNMKIASGVAPIERLRTEGVNCTVGTDGPSSNNDLDMWEEMRNASFLQKVTTMDPCAVPAYELLRMATVCGAAAIGHAGELGVVKEGALADLVLLSTQRPYYHPQHDVVANVAYCAKAADVDTVVVDGEVVVDGGRLSTVDLPSLYARAGAAVRRIAGEL